MHESLVFKPKYKASHWFHLFEPLIVYIIAASTYLFKQVMMRKVYVELNIPIPDYNKQLLVLVGLFGIAAILRMISFLVNDHMRKIELNNDGIVFHRLLGRRLVAEYKSMKWNDSVLILTKRHSFTIVSISNREAMKEYLGEYLDMTPDEPVQNEKKKVYTAWDDLKVIVIVVLIVVIIGTAAVMLDSWEFEPSDTVLWAFDGGLAFILCIQIFFISRKLLF
jgi:hypothetical protein